MTNEKYFVFCCKYFPDKVQAIAKFSLDLDDLLTKIALHKKRSDLKTYIRNHDRISVFARSYKRLVKNSIDSNIRQKRKNLKQWYNE